MNALPELAGSAVEILPDMKNLGGATKNATAGLGRMAPALLGSAGGGHLLHQELDFRRCRF